MISEYPRASLIKIPLSDDKKKVIVSANPHGSKEIEGFWENVWAHNVLSIFSLIPEN